MPLRRGWRKGQGQRLSVLSGSSAASIARKNQSHYCIVKLPTFKHRWSESVHLEVTEIHRASQEMMSLQNCQIVMSHY